MPSKNAPCPCPSCKGAVKSAKVRRKHASLQVQLAASKSDWYHAYENALQAATSNNADNESDPDNQSIDSEDIPIDEMTRVGNTSFGKTS